MSPITYAAANFAIVLITTVILPCFTLLGFGFCKIRSWMASCRPVIVKAAISQIQTELVPVVGRLEFHAEQLLPEDVLQRLHVAITINPSTVAETIQPAMPGSFLVEEPLKEPVLKVEVENSSTPGPAPSSMFEIWINKIFTMKEEFTDEEYSLSSSYSLASTIDTDCTSPHSIGTVEVEHEPNVNVCEPEDEDIDDVLSINTESICVGLVSSSSSTDLSAISDEGNKDALMIMITPPTPKIDWEEDSDNDTFESLLIASPSFTALANALEEEELDVTAIEEEDDGVYSDNDAFESLLIASPSFTALASASDDEEFDRESIDERKDDGLDEAMQAMNALISREFEPIAAAEEPEDEGIAEHPPYTTLALLPSSRSVIKQDTPQHSHDKENRNERSPTKHRYSLKTLPTFGSVTSISKVIPTIKFTPPTPSRNFIDKEDVSLESELYEHTERVAFDMVVDDDGSFFF